MKLIYFNGMGRAELARLILAQAGVEYEDCRIEMEKWPDLKQTMVTGTVPVLEVDEVQISESIAIARFLAKKYCLIGESEIEAAQADMIVDCCQGVTNEMVRAFFEPDEETKKQLIDKSKANTKVFFGNMQNILQKNGGEFMVGKQLTWADISMAFMMDKISNTSNIIYGNICPDVLENFKPLADLMVKVYDYPNIKAWIEKRPKTEF